MKRKGGLAAAAAVFQWALLAHEVVRAAPAVAEAPGPAAQGAPLPRRAVPLLQRSALAVARRGGRRRSEGSSALARQFVLIDGKTPDLKGKLWKPGECANLVRAVVANQTVDSTSRGKVAKPVKKNIINTGIFLRSLSGKAADTVLAKVRLSILSFLATQDLDRTRLQVWSDLDPASGSNPLRAALKPLLAQPRLAAAVALRRFDAAAEFGKVPTNTGQLLLNLYDQSPQLALKSDLERVAILYSYGGVWVDADMLFIQDFSPLMGEDWAYLGQQNWINNAALSVSEPASLFATVYLNALVGQQAAEVNSTAYSRYGAVILKSLFDEEWSRNTFHVLPSCFFDGGWSGEEGATSWDEFWSAPIDEGSLTRLAYLYPHSSDEDTFAYHWHGRWSKPVSERSMAHALSRIYAWRLGLELA